MHFPVILVPVSSLQLNRGWRYRCENARNLCAREHIFRNFMDMEIEIDKFVIPNLTTLYVNFYQYC